MTYSRRSFLKIGTLASTTLAAPAALGQTGASVDTAIQDDARKLDITVAGYDYNVLKALVDGRVQVEGCNMQYQPGRIGDLQYARYLWATNAALHGDRPCTLYSGLRKQWLS